MQLSFHVWDSRIRCSPIASTKTTFIKLFKLRQNKNKFCFIHTTRNKVYEAQVVYMENIRGSM